MKAVKTAVNSWDRQLSAQTILWTISYFVINAITYNDAYPQSHGHKDLHWPEDYVLKQNQNSF